MFITTSSQDCTKSVVVLDMLFSALYGRTNDGLFKVPNSFMDVSANNYMHPLHKLSTLPLKVREK